MESSERLKTSLTLILSSRRGEANSARHDGVCVQVQLPLLLEKRRGEGEELTVI